MVNLFLYFNIINAHIVESINFIIVINIYFRQTMHNRWKFNGNRRRFYESNEWKFYTKITVIHTKYQKDKINKTDIIFMIYY